LAFSAVYNAQVDIGAMGAPGRKGCGLKDRVSHFQPFPPRVSMAWHGRLPVLGPDRNVLQLVSAERAQSLIDSGRVVPVGTKTRVRALIATYGSEEFLFAPPGRRGRRPILTNHETDDNPRGVWTFRKISGKSA